MTNNAMSKQTDFFHETLSAANEIIGGSLGSWGGKVTAGITLSFMQSVEAATIAIAVFLVLCIIDALLGVMRQVKINRQPGSVNVPIKVWRLISGPASKWLVGGVVLLAASFFDNVMFGADAWVGGPVLKFCTGVVLGAILIEVIAKADYLQRWGLGEKLRKKFPELFSTD